MYFGTFSKLFRISSLLHTLAANPTPQIPSLTPPCSISKTVGSIKPHDILQNLWYLHSPFLCQPALPCKQTRQDKHPTASSPAHFPFHVSKLFCLSSFHRTDKQITLNGGSGPTLRRPSFASRRAGLVGNGRVMMGDRGSNPSSLLSLMIIVFLFFLSLLIE